MTKKKEPLLSSIEQSLACGRFIPYGASGVFVDGLERAKSQIDSLVEQQDAARAVALYETFMAGCYNKMEELDDSSGNMGMFFEDLFCAWVTARCAAGLQPEETVSQILKWMDNDEYALCDGIENKLAAALDKEETFHLEKTAYARFEDGFSRKTEGWKTIYDFSPEVRDSIGILKAIYAAGNRPDEYLELCQKIGITPKDCEAIANIYKAEKQWEKALHFVNKGLSLEDRRMWADQASFGLSNLRRELLVILGRKEEAMQIAWQEFIAAPSEYSYEELMKYVSREDKGLWHRRAVNAVCKPPLDSGIIGLFIQAKELEILSGRILCAGDDKLEELGYYALKDAAKALSD